MKRPHSVLFVIWSCCVVLAGCGVFEPAPDAGSDMSEEMDLPGADMPVDLEADMAPAPKPVGQACERPNDCVAGAACVGTGGGAFVCMATCEQAQRLCPGGEVCTGLGVGMNLSVCFAGGRREVGEACSSNLECVAGALCFGAMSERFCLRACDGAQGCAEDEVCSATTSGLGFCRARVGQECDISSDCDAGLECSYELEAPVRELLSGGSCTALCDSDGECGAGSICGFVDEGQNARACVQTCAADWECRFAINERCVGPSECETTGMPAVCDRLTMRSKVCLIGL